MRIHNSWRKTTIYQSFKILTKSDQRKVFATLILQISFGLLDLLGIAAIGLLGALAINRVESRKPGNRVNGLLQTLGIENYSLQIQVTILGCIAAALLIAKTLFSIYFMRKTLFFLSRKAASISADLISRLFSRSLLTLQAKSMNEMVYGVTNGVNSLIIGVLGTFISLISDVSLLVLMALGLFVADPIVAFSTYIVFGFIGYLLYRLMHVKAKSLGFRNTNISIKSNEQILEALGSYRETVVRNRREYYSREIGSSRLDLANVQAELSFLPNISKYVMEMAVVLGSLAISAVQFMVHDAPHAIAVLSIFLAASTRIAPAALRIQQGSILIKSNLGGITPTLELIQLLINVQPIKRVDDRVDTTHIGFYPRVSIREVSLTYPSKTIPAVDGVSLEINPGEIVAIVGSAGAGKTTLVDLLLGVLDADAGEVLISGLPPLECFSNWPGAVSYVPQDVLVSNGTIRENVAMGFPKIEATDELVWNALNIAQLDEFVRSLANGLDTPVGDRGTRISGGQRQRLGIARAMFTKPMMLVLDEATSSLDGETESNISDAIQNMRGSVTVLMIAHRLSTVRNADKVIYMDEGRVLAIGNFEEVRESVPNFDRQASLMGL